MTSHAIFGALEYSEGEFIDASSVTRGCRPTPAVQGTRGRRESAATALSFRRSDTRSPCDGADERRRQSHGADYDSIEKHVNQHFQVDRPTLGGSPSYAALEVKFLSSLIMTPAIRSRLAANSTTSLAFVGHVAWVAPFLRSGRLSQLSPSPRAATGSQRFPSREGTSRPAQRSFVLRCRGA